MQRSSWSLPHTQFTCDALSVFISSVRAPSTPSSRRRSDCDTCAQQCDTYRSKVPAPPGKLDFRMNFDLAGDWCDYSFIKTSTYTSTAQKSWRSFLILTRASTSYSELNIHFNISFYYIWLVRNKKGSMYMCHYVTLVPNTKKFMTAHLYQTRHGHPERNLSLQNEISPNWMYLCILHIYEL